MLVSDGLSISSPEGERGRRGEWSGCVDHFVKGTRSYWPGLFRG
jgi:hypothetical protein